MLLLLLLLGHLKSQKAMAAAAPVAAAAAAQVTAVQRLAKQLQLHCDASDCFLLLLLFGQPQQSSVIAAC
jgi:hypothetical protein